MRYVKLAVIVFLSAALFTGLCYWIGLTGAFLKFSNWFYGLPVLQQMYTSGVIALVLNIPLIYWLGKISQPTQVIDLGTDSETGEPIKSLSQIKAEGFGSKPVAVCPACNTDLTKKVGVECQTCGRTSSSKKGG